MNKQRRKDIDKVIETLNSIKGTIEDAFADAESIRDEEQEYFDNMPENMQYGEKGENAQAAISALETAVSALDDIDLDEIIGSLEEAQS